MTGGFSRAVLVAAVIFLGGCKTLSVFPNDFPETVPMVASCEAGRPGEFTMMLKEGDGKMTPASGQSVQSPLKPYRVQSQFTPERTGRSRAGAIECYHSADRPGKPVVKRFIVRDRIEPTTSFNPPVMAIVGRQFAIPVEIRDEPAGAGLGEASGIDRIQISTTGPLSVIGQVDIDLSGKMPGPPEGSRGPTAYDTPIQVVCTDPGKATLRLLVIDAAQNQGFSRIHDMVCVKE